MNEIYLDYTATTPLHQEALEAMVAVLEKDYGNPSSPHNKGLEIEKKIDQARRFFAKTLGLDPKEFYFTSGGTEGNNLALLGLARRNQRRGKHVMVSAIEHPSVLEAARQLEAEGFDVTYLPVDSQGQVGVEDLVSCLREDTILVSVMAVNNEIGSRQAIEAIGASLPEDVCFHVDGVQFFGKFPLAKKARIDAMTISGHKIGGPKGIGGLFIKSKWLIAPILYGGGQEGGLRPGTENTAGIMGFYAAAKKQVANQARDLEKVQANKTYLVHRLQEDLPQVRYQGGPPLDFDQMSPYILNIAYPGVKGEVLLHALEAEKIYVSTGSACSTKKRKVSSVLKGMGLSDQEADGAIRVSLSPWTQQEDLDRFIDVYSKQVSFLSRFIKK